MAGGADEPARSDDKAIPPLYLVRSVERCPKCGRGLFVHALAAAGVYDAKLRRALRPFILFHHITRISERFIELVSTECRGYSFDDSDLKSFRYLMNHCRCGAKLEDDSLHLVPGAAFTPQSKSERRIPQLFILPFEQELPITASYTQGSQRLVTGLKPRPW